QALKQVVQGIALRAVDDICLEVVGASVGDVTPSDVELASSGGEALVLAFNVGIQDAATRAAAKQLDVPIHRDEVIYRLEDELVRAMLAYLPKERVVKIEGSAVVQQVFKMSGSKSTVVAGLMVQSGKLRNKALFGETAQYLFRVTRGEQVILEESGDSDLKRFKEDVHEVEHGVECGLSLEGFGGFQAGDVVE
ncbi:hypothetical protein B484DRAFT_301361, partial [Ochromonadaceae sp. CCMP2298]